MDGDPNPLGEFYTLKDEAENTSGVIADKDVARHRAVWEILERQAILLDELSQWKKEIENA